MAYPGMTVYITVKASDLQSAWRTTQLSKGRATDEMAVRRRREDALGIAAKSDEWTPDSLERSIQKVKSKRQLTARFRGVLRPSARSSSCRTSLACRRRSPEVRNSIG